ncbi:MAG TPA: hypothetical protein DEP61_02795 [Lachnospiraceae bacterium]|jgi:hypothetical protein|nr:hypothetical protein [Lachnospiraceae bacterium]
MQEYYEEFEYTGIDNSRGTMVSGKTGNFSFLAPEERPEIIKRFHWSEGDCAHGTKGERLDGG